MIVDFSYIVSFYSLLVSVIPANVILSNVIPENVIPVNASLKTFAEDTLGFVVRYPLEDVYVGAYRTHILDI